MCHSVTELLMLQKISMLPIRTCVCVCLCVYLLVALGRFQCRVSCILVVDVRVKPVDFSPLTWLLQLHEVKLVEKQQEFGSFYQVFFFILKINPNSESRWWICSFDPMVKKMDDFIFSKQHTRMRNTQNQNKLYLMKIIISFEQNNLFSMNIMQKFLCAIVHILKFSDDKPHLLHEEWTDACFSSIINKFSLVFT